MALYTDLPVYRDTYQLILKVFEYTREFRKERIHKEQPGLFVHWQEGMLGAFT